MGTLQPTKIRLRAYGTQTFIHVHGEIAATLQSENGARRTTAVYVVEGHQAEPLATDYRQHLSSRGLSPHHNKRE